MKKTRSQAASVTGRWATMMTIRSRASAVSVVDEIGLRGGIERRGRLVEDDNFRASKQSARDCDSLFLSDRQARATPPEHRRVSVGQAIDKFRRTRHRGRFANLGPRRAGASVADVVLDRNREQRLILKYEPDARANRVGGDLARVDAVESDGSRRRFDKTRDRVDERCLAASARSRQARPSRRRASTS